MVQLSQWVVRRAYSSQASNVNNAVVHDEPPPLGVSMWCEYVWQKPSGAYVLVLCVAEAGMWCLCVGAMCAAMGLCVGAMCDMCRRMPGGAICVIVELHPAEAQYLSTGCSLDISLKTRGFAL